MLLDNRLFLYQIGEYPLQGYGTAVFTGCFGKKIALLLKTIVIIVALNTIDVLGSTWFIIHNQLSTQSTVQGEIRCRTT
jgi:hypothetical protein